ncbi:hypothetical protein VNI00_014930 [Paramarasmius palmivorus]|uniref:Uncharacterized protein n=1 Tax=Paramarasmius palmivorus TaxID=297713 RepID=A0AAW0BNQ9_9AGAR
MLNRNHYHPYQPAAGRRIYGPHVPLQPDVDAFVGAFFNSPHWLQFNQRLQSIEEQMGYVVERLEGLEERLANIEGKAEYIEEKVDSTDGGFEDFGGRLDEIRRSASLIEVMAARAHNRTCGDGSVARYVPGASSD